MAPIDVPAYVTKINEDTSVRADQHVNIVWIVEDPSYVPPEVTITSTSCTSLIVTQTVKVDRKRHPESRRYFRGRVEQPLRGKVKPDYVRKKCSRHDRQVNKRKTHIQSFKTRKFLRYLNYLKSR